MNIWKIKTFRWIKKCRSGGLFELASNKILSKIINDFWKGLFRENYVPSKVRNRLSVGSKESIWNMTFKFFFLVGIFLGKFAKFKEHYFVSISMLLKSENEFFLSS